MNNYDLANSLYVVTEEHYGDGDIIFNEGTSGDWIYVVLSGQVEIFKIVRGKRIVVDSLNKGDLFGEVSFVDKRDRSAGARAVGKVTLGVYDRAFLTQEYNKLPKEFRAIFDALARRLRKMTSVATNLAGRRNERTEKNFEIHFKTKQDFYKAYTANLGSGGLFIRTENLLEIGSEVTLLFTLPGDSKPINAVGKTVWVSKQPDPDKGVGVQFTVVSPEDRTRIDAFVRQNPRGERI